MDRLQPLSVAAPGKVNLSLLVGPRRADGYHELFTVFYPLGLADRLTFTLEARPPGGAALDLRVVCPGIDQEDNLVTRALRALEAASGWRLGGEVLVEKGLPVAGGVGGGSSDAAQALLAGARVLTAAGGPALEAAALHALAARLGADVPFFLDPRPALARGVGERLEPLPLPAAAPGAGRQRCRAVDCRRVQRVRRARTRAGKADAAFAEPNRRAERSWREALRGLVDRDLDEEAVVRRVAPRLLQNDLECPCSVPAAGADGRARPPAGPRGPRRCWSAGPAPRWSAFSISRSGRRRLPWRCAVEDCRPSSDSPGGSPVS